MTDTAVAADLGQALDVERNFTAKVALNGVVFVNNFTQSGLLIFRQILDADVATPAAFRMSCALFLPIP